MKAAEVRDQLRAVRMLREAIGRMEKDAISSLTVPAPGSIVKHHQTGVIAVIKDQQGQVVIDFHSDAGLRPIGEEELISWDVIQEPNYGRT